MVRGGLELGGRGKRIALVRKGFIQYDDFDQLALAQDEWLNRTQDSALINSLDSARHALIVLATAPKPAVAEGHGSALTELETQILDAASADVDLAEVASAEAAGFGEFEGGVAVFEGRCAAGGHGVETHE